ncbi:MAG: hypothetical protein M9890_06620 [Thermomicrobiales bacterium]|nr:hypothetical protein [Thermomicrobiales bacterium]
MDFYIAQTLDGVEDPDRKQLRLRAVSYVYALQPHSWDDRIVRWEYVKFPAQESFWCRHHLQGPLEFAIRDSRGAIHTSTLNEWHLPTGWVTIEEVIRFCLHDLEASALTDRQEWHAALNDSIEIFRTRFSAFGET